jgi:hypothetical protein
MRRILIALEMLLGLAASAVAQNATGLVVPSCGVVPAQFAAGNPSPFTVDVNGQFCTGTGGSVSGSQTGVPTTTGLAVSACGNQTFVATRPGPFTVSAFGQLCN